MSTTGPDHHDGQQLSAVPVAVAFVLAVVLGTFAYLYLRDDDAGRLVEPDTVTVVGPDMVEVGAFGPFDGTATVLQVGYAIGDDAIAVELVVDVDKCDDCEPTDSVRATLVLPEPIDGRDVRAGTGRALAECRSDDDHDAAVCRA